MLRLATAIAVLAATAVPPTAVAAERPGSIDATLGRFATSRVEGMDVATDGHIVIAGRTDGYPLWHPWVRTYLPSGVPDPAFDEDGIVALEDDRRLVAGAVFQDDGRVIVAQSSDPYSYYAPGPVPHLLTRLTREGRPDPSFGSGGSVQPDLGAGRTTVTDIALQPDGRLIVLGTRERSSTAPLVLIVERLLPDGSPDPTFGVNGVTEVPTGAPGSSAAMAPQPGGGVLLSIRRNLEPAIARVTAQGRLDESFGGGGVAPMQLARREWAGRLRKSADPAPLVVLSNGHIRAGLEFQRADDDRYRMGLIGLTEDGHPDRGFADGGRALGPLPTRGGESARTAIADGRGSVLVSGGIWSGEDFAFEHETLIRRFRADGSLDRSFGTDGLVRGHLPDTGYSVFSQRLRFQDRNTLVVAGHVYDGKYGFWGDARLEVMNAGYDRDGPVLLIRSLGCRSLGIRARDLTGVRRIVVRSHGRVLRRTGRARLRIRVAPGIERITVRAVDVAGNRSARFLRLPFC